MKTTTLLVSLLLASPAFANDVDPFGFEKEHFVSSKARAEVRAELQVARATGQLPVGELGVRFIDTPSTISRAQVTAETQAAARLGLLRYGEIGPVQATTEQQEQIKQAGLRAIGAAAAD